MAKLNFQHHYSSVQCHMILQKSFQHPALMFRKRLLLLSILKFIFFFFQDSLMKRKFKRTAFI